MKKPNLKLILPIVLLFLFIHFYSFLLFCYLISKLLLDTRQDILLVQLHIPEILKNYLMDTTKAFESEKESDNTSATKFWKIPN